MDKQWYKEKEQVHTSAPILLTLWLVKVLPLPVVCGIIFPVIAISPILSTSSFPVVIVFLLFEIF